VNNVIHLVEITCPNQSTHQKNKIMNATDLKIYLQSYLGNLVGYYQVGESKIPAIRIGLNNMPSDKKYGLEVVIDSLPIQTDVKMNTYCRNWNVNIIAQKNSDQNLELAYNKLLQLEMLTHIKYLPAYKVSNDLQIPDQIQLLLKDDTLQINYT
jgi:hypothetical protein